MTDERASVGATVVENRLPPIGGNYVHVKIYKSVTADSPVSASYPVCSMTHGARKAGADMDGVLGPACVLHYIAGQIMALPTHRIRSIYSKVGVGK